jgi:hypothetical protein
MTSRKNLVAVLPFGNYPALVSACQKLELQVTTTKTLRKAVGLIKQISPEIIVAEFVYAPTYGSQLSNFESLFATAQSYAPDSCFIALTHSLDLQHILKIANQFPCCVIEELPTTAAKLEHDLKTILLRGN